MRKDKHHILCIVLIINILSLIYINDISALSYESSVGIGFTFNPTLSINISSSDLVISNLKPGTTEDSNSINVSVATNAAYGYTLSATVGDSLHNDTNLTHTNNTNVFSSIAIDADLSSLDEDEGTNIWGYSYRNNITSPSTWSNYNGLSSSSNTILLDNSNAADSTGGIDFKIGAKAGDAQASGTYTNTINFIAVSKVAPVSLLDSFIASGVEQYNGYYKMQDMTHDICQNVDIEESELQLIDVRDNKIYWVAKLKDGNCWMTQNLDLSGGTELSSNDTDFTDTYTLPETKGWAITGNKLILPTSNADGFATDNYAYVYNSKNTTNCGSNGQHIPCHSYYSWDAATIGSGRDLNTINTDAPYSICPKNWKLPTTRTTASLDWQTESDFYTLANQYGFNSDTSTQESNNEFYLRAGPGTTPNFLLAGVYYYGSFVGIDSGNYWSSTSNGVRAFGLSFSNTGIDTTSNNIRRYGCSVRCLTR